MIAVMVLIHAMALMIVLGNREYAKNILTVGAVDDIPGGYTQHPLM